MSNGKVEKQEPVATCVYEACNKNLSFLFATKTAADAFASKQPTSAGIRVHERQLFAYTAPTPCPECASRANGSSVLVPVEDLRKLKAELAEWKDMLDQVLSDTAKELGCQADNEEILETIAKLKAERDELAAQVTHWKANHASVVEQARILKERPDMPIERVKAYESYVALQARCTELEKKVSLLKDTSTHWSALMEQEKEIIGLHANLAAAEKVMGQAESIVSMAVKTMRAAHVHRAEIYDMTEKFLKAIAAYKKGDKA